MRINIAQLKLASSVTIGVICIIGLGGTVRAEPITGQIVEQTPGDSVTPSKWPEVVASPASASSDIADEKNKATVSKPAQEPLVMDRQSIPPPAGGNEMLLNHSGRPIIESPGSLAGDASVNEGGLLSRELKENVRPLYEDLAGSAVVETLRDLKSDLGLNGSPSFKDPASSDYSKNVGNSDTTESAPWEKSGNRYGPDNRPRTAAQIEKDKLATAVMIDEFVETVKPWLYGLAGLYILGYMVKLGLDYFRWKTTRSHKPLRGRRRHRRSQGPTDSRST